MREMIPAWFRIEEGFRATTKQPYMELEVLPVANGWRWTVESMSPQSGRFRVLGAGVCKSERAAKRAAMDKAGLL